MSRRQQPTTRLPLDAMNAFPFMESSDLKTFGKKGGRISYLNFQGKKLRIQMGKFDDPVSFPFGISEPYSEETQQQQGQNQYQQYQQQGFQQPQQQQQQQQQAGYGFPGQQPMNYSQQPQPGQGWNTTGPQPAPGPAPMTGKKTLSIQFKEDSLEYKMIEKFDEEILKLCAKNWPKWFNGQQKTVEQLVETYSRSLKLKDQNGNPVPPRFGTKLDVEEVDVTVYAGEDEKETDESGLPKKIMYPGTVKDVTKRSGGRAVVEPMGIWFVGGRFGVSSYTKRICVFANLQDDDDEFAEDENVEMRSRPTNLVLKGSSSERDDDDVPNAATTANAGNKRTADQAGLLDPKAKRQNLGLATGQPGQVSVPNAGGQMATPTPMVTPGQAILPPVNP